MKPKHVKRLLSSAVAEVAGTPEAYCVNPDRDFTRTRKISLQKLISGIINMECKSLPNELIDMFKGTSDIPSVSAFVQQRDKLKPEAFEAVFNKFTARLTVNSGDMPVLAVDGSDVRLPTNPDDKLTYLPGSRTQDPYNSLHINALYDLNQHLYRAVVIQNGAQRDECSALQQLVDRSDIHLALVIADRGYESYNNLAHIQEKGWYFLIRIKDGNYGIKNGFDLPNEDCFDQSIVLNLTRKQTNEVKQLIKDRNHFRYIANSSPFDYLPQYSRKADPLVFYTLKFRIVRFKISSNTYETVITNLPGDKYPPEKLKELYASRWGIETSFRDLKYTIGLLKYHSKKTACIRQEIFARLTLYNFVEVITSHVAISKKQRKYTYKCNFSVATHVCRLFLHGQTSPPYVESAIAKCLIPIRPNRKRNRFVLGEVLQRFFYRVA
ncbi:IS4 family transposase [Butyrivibrio sp. AE2032]|uniref:IS4 family transposase n=1 Tax=Butyrivibrio sp. AE2032 TaxID=1458463 RepID=UPI00054EA973|nr:IS4 family transposase [Butyrivibrio sp. AE2032]